MAVGGRVKEPKTMLHHPRCAAVISAVVLLLCRNAHAQDDQSLQEKIQLCATCHGEQGIPINKQTPVIWGQNEGYLYLQLRDFKNGTRKSAVMGPIASQLQKDDMRALAAHFTTLKWSNLEQPEATADVAKRALTVSSSVGCPGCHLQHFEGNGTTARIAGQWQEYLSLTMSAFRDGSRGNNPGMSSLMKASAPADITALSQYLAGLQIDAYLGRGN
jgi:cytochrome c553